MMSSERLIITPIEELETQDPLFVKQGKKLKASPKMEMILENSNLRLEHIHTQSKQPLRLHNSAYSPKDQEVIRNPYKALCGELSNIKLYRIVLDRYHILFEFYNANTKQLSSLQPTCGGKNFAFTVECNDKTYRICFKWSRYELCKIVTVWFKAKGQIFYRKLHLLCDYGEEEYEEIVGTNHTNFPV